MPAGVYEGVKEDLNSLGIVVNMVVHKDLPDDLVYQMCKTFWANHATFAEVKVGLEPGEAGKGARRRGDPGPSGRAEVLRRAWRGVESWLTESGGLGT